MGRQKRDRLEIKSFIVWNYVLQGELLLPRATFKEKRSYALSYSPFKSFFLWVLFVSKYKEEGFQAVFSFSYQTMISQLIKSYSAGAVRRNLVETETKPHQTQWSLIGDNHHHLHQVIMPKLRPNCETSMHSLPFSWNLIFWWLERCWVVIEYHYREPLRHCWCLMTFTFLDLMHYQG